MRVAVEVRTLQRKRRAGIGNYIARLVGALGETDGDNHYALVTVDFLARQRDAPIDVSAPNLAFEPIRVLPQRAFLRLRKRGWVPPFDWFVRGKDVFLFTSFVDYPLRRTPFCLVVYDLSFELSPESVPDAYRRRLAATVGDAAARASVVTVSETAKRELVDHYDLPPNKIVVAPPGLDHDVFRPVPDPDGAHVRARLGLPERYFLFVGTLEPRKNLVQLLRAYAALAAETKSREALVLVGMKGWKDEALVSELARLEAGKERVHRIGYLDERDLPAVYSGATAFVYPSLYEGFGMPLLEAMACGAPVITSDRSAMPEVVGDAALLVDPTDVAQITAAMSAVATDEQLSGCLVERGLARARESDWGRTASCVVEALEIAAGSARSQQR